MRSQLTGCPHRKHPMPNPLDYATDKERQRLKELDAIIAFAAPARKERRKIMDRLVKRQKASRE